LASPRIAGLEAPELMVMGAETTLEKAAGRDDRRGLVSMFAVPSTLALMAKT
jgi:hypothetical protein